MKFFTNNSGLAGALIYLLLSGFVFNSCGTSINIPKISEYQADKVTYRFAELSDS